MTQIEQIPALVQRLDKDLKKAANSLSSQEARFLVDTYYTVQNNRIRAANQVRAMGEEPHDLLAWLSAQYQMLENNLKVSLDVYTSNHPVGEWLRSVKGIGPVISAGLLAHIDINRSPTAGNLWSYAGLTSGTTWIGGAKAEKAVKAFINGSKEVLPSDLLQIAKELGCDPKWLARRSVRAATGLDIPFRGQETTDDRQYVLALIADTPLTLKNVVDAVSKRPWNATLKVICWKAGQSFVKVSGNPEAVYGKIYKERKVLEVANNAAGLFREQAETILKSKRIGKDTEAYKAYSIGQLPAAHLQARACRYAVKHFLSDLHGEMYRTILGKEPPIPYVIAHGGHAHYEDRS